MGRIQYQSGRDGEALAENYLKKNGYKILVRNYRVSYAEIDLIASKNKELYFFEVKSRGEGSLIDPLEAYSEKQRSRIYRAAEQYLIELNSRTKLPACNFGLITVHNLDSIECILETF